jgi:FkbH-like protein
MTAPQRIHLVSREPVPELAAPLRAGAPGGPPYEVTEHTLAGPRAPDGGPRAPDGSWLRGLPAAVPDDDAPVVLVVTTEDVFGELDLAAPGDDPGLAAAGAGPLLAGSRARIAAAAALAAGFLAGRGSRYVVVPPVLAPVPLPVAERAAALKLARLPGRITDALIDALDGVSGGSVLDIDAALASVARERWRADGVHQALHPGAAALLARAVLARLAPVVPPKVLVTDLDGTLWPGTISEVGPEGIALAGEAGAVHRAWQRSLLCARGQGFILAVASRNDPDAMAPFEADEVSARAGMLTRPDDFAAISAAWAAKSGQLAGIAGRLELPLSAFVFADDNPLETHEVATSAPEVTVLRFPAGGRGWAAFCAGLQELTAVADAPLTQEDHLRAHYYALRGRAERARAQTASAEDFLASLHMRLGVSLLPAAAAADPACAAAGRVRQLLNRANRFHLTGHRYDDAAWRELTARPEVSIATARLTDRYGDHGICAAAVLESGPEGPRLAEFAMSCRVLGRNVEAAMADWLAGRGRGLRVAWRRTGHNDTALDAFARLGFTAAPAGQQAGELLLTDRDLLRKHARFIAADGPR